jgi:hypothetical protein
LLLYLLSSKDVMIFRELSREPCEVIPLCPVNNPISVSSPTRQAWQPSYRNPRFVGTSARS